jgi:hypothetical protein
MLSLLRIVRYAGTHHASAAASHGSSHGHEGHHAEGHGSSHGDHNLVSHHYYKKVPENSWHRHSDDEDPYYYYDRYGPFHTFSVAYHAMPDHPGGTPEDDIYRHEKQGYIRIADPDDNRRNIYRGIVEGMIFTYLLFLGVSIAGKRTQFDDDCAEKRAGEALIIAQEIEIFINNAKEKLQ